MGSTIFFNAFPYPVFLLSFTLFFNLFAYRLANLWRGLDRHYVFRVLLALRSVGCIPVGSRSTAKLCKLEASHFPSACLIRLRKGDSG